jgi:Xaa-Pro aminopeptidase
MDPDLSALDAFLDEGDLDGYLINDSSDLSDQRYLTGFEAGDPFVSLYDGAVHLLVSPLEYGRAKKESRADSVSRGVDFEYWEKAEEYGPTEASHRVLAEFLGAHDVSSVAVPSRYPLASADGLRAQSIEVTADEDDTIREIRAVKTPEEVEHIRVAQRANEDAMARAEELIREATVGEDGLLYRGDEPLTSEFVRREIEMELLRQGCALDETIVACGADAADPHDRGSGPLRANEGIIIDIFPRSKETGYFADMTRSFVKGEASDTLREWYELTAEALEAALAEVKPGAVGADIHGAVCDIYEEAGLPTLRSDESAETGFIHSTGHGVGLDIHEGPSVSTRENEIEAGHVITIEPGLYDPEIGGVRIEDIIVVTADGYENLTEYPRGLDTYELP